MYLNSSEPFEVNSTTSLSGVCLTLGVLTVVVKGLVARSRWRTEFVAIFVVLCLHVRFVCEFTYFSGGRGRRRRVLYVNFRSFRLFNIFDVHISW